MVGGGQAPEIPMELQEDVLRELFGGRSVLKEVEGDAEHHPLMASDQGLELERLLEFGLVFVCGESGPHPSRDLYEKDGAPGCRPAYFSSAGVFVSGPMPAIWSRAGSSLAPS